MDESPELRKALFDLVESEAIEKYYLWNEREQRYAVKPVITINRGFTAAKSTQQKPFTLYFGAGIEYWNFKNIKQAHLKVGEILKGRKAKVVTDKGKERIVQYSTNEQITSTNADNQSKVTD